MKKIGLVLDLCLVLFLSACQVVPEKDSKKQLQYTICSYDNLPMELQTEVDRSKGEPFQIFYTNRNNIFIVIGYGGQYVGNYGIRVEQLYALRDGYYIETELIGKELEKEGKQEVVFTPYIIVKTPRLYGKYSETLHILE